MAPTLSLFTRCRAVLTRRAFRAVRRETQTAVDGVVVSRHSRGMRRLSPRVTARFTARLTAPLTARATGALVLLAGLAALAWRSPPVAARSGDVGSGDVASGAGVAGSSSGKTLPGDVAVAVLATAREAFATATDVRIVHLPTGSVRALGTVAHGAGAVVRGDVLPDRDDAVVVVADVGEGDFGASLFRVGGGSVVALASGLAHASRPLAARDGWVYVERGEPGPPPSGDAVERGELRKDRLALDAVEPGTGRVRRLYTAEGYALHLVGEHENEILVYEVAFGRAELLGIDRRSGAPRAITKVAPTARDFLVDEARHAVVFRALDGSSGYGPLAHDVRSGRLDASALTGLASVGNAGASLLAPKLGGASAPAAIAADGAWVTLQGAEGGAAAGQVTVVHRPSASSWTLGDANERVDAIGLVGRAQEIVR